MKTTLSLFIASLICVCLHAQPGTLDSSFGTNGILMSSIQGGYLSVSDAATQSTGKIICTGDGNDGIANGGFFARRFNSDGTLDNSFGNDGITFVNFGDDFIEVCNAMAIQPDNKIVLTGYAIKGFFNPIYYIATIRLTAEGILDSSFGTNGFILTTAGINGNDILVQADGKIVVSGFNVSSFITLRYLSNGLPDNSFGVNGIVTTNFGIASKAIANASQADGKLVVAGNNGSEIILVRYNDDGSLDKQFGNLGHVISNISSDNENVSDVIIESNGKIIIAGNSTTINSIDSPFLVRYTSTGDLDDSFGLKGIAKSKLPFSADFSRIKEQSNGNIIVCGHNELNNDKLEHFLIERFKNDGNVDSAFGNKGFQVTEVSTPYDGARNLVIQKDNKIVACGSAIDNNNPPSYYGVAMVRYFGDQSQKQLIINKIKHYIQTHNNAATMSDSLSNANMSVYPNPASNVVTIKGFNASKNYQLKITNANGIVITNVTVSNGNTYQFNIENLSGGVYYINVISNKKNITVLKFIKQ